MTITPDTKDWTWVLHTTCPDCGLDAGSLSRADIGPQLRQAAGLLQEALRAPNATERPTPEVWSALEYGCHVRDVFTIFLGRLERILAEDNPLFANWDQDQTALDDQYGAQDPADVIVALGTDVVPLAERFETLDDALWKRPGRRSDGAVFTVLTLGQYLVHDPVHHAWDVARTPLA